MSWSKSCPFSCRRLFPLSAQYKGALAGEEDNADDDQDDAASPERKPKAKQTKPVAKQALKEKKCQASAACTASAYKPHLYNEKRNIFLAASNLPYKEAVQAWNGSEERREFLSGLNLRELKKRKFVPKTCNVNPFKDPELP